jgi:hypothetical protein
LFYGWEVLECCLGSNSVMEVGSATVWCAQDTCMQCCCGALFGVATRLEGLLGVDTWAGLPACLLVCVCEDA